jgi:hypothetical protein
MLADILGNGCHLTSMDELDPSTINSVDVSNTTEEAPGRCMIVATVVLPNSLTVTTDKSTGLTPTDSVTDVLCDDDIANTAQFDSSLTRLMTEY